MLAWCGTCSPLIVSMLLDKNRETANRFGHADNLLHHVIDYEILLLVIVSQPEVLIGLVRMLASSVSLQEQSIECWLSSSSTVLVNNRRTKLAANAMPSARVYVMKNISERPQLEEIPNNKGIFVMTRMCLYWVTLLCSVHYEVTNIIKSYSISKMI